MYFCFTIMNSSDVCACPVCYKKFSGSEIDDHVNKCLCPIVENYGKENSLSEMKSSDQFQSESSKKNHAQVSLAGTSNQEDKVERSGQIKCHTDLTEDNIPLAERMRPQDLSHFVGQEHILGHAKTLRTLIEKNDVPNMILWGPPGCGKTSLAHIIANQCKNNNNRYRFEKLSATMDGVDRVKEVVKIAKNEAASFKRHTLLFVDEIHRFNKIQQDVFLPHVESGVIILIGATTENPSFKLNRALLSRCCVYVMKKLLTEDITQIIKQALDSIGIAVLKSGQKCFQITSSPWAMLDEASVIWIAEVCDGDARIALNSIQRVQNLMQQKKEAGHSSGVVSLTFNEVKECVKRSHILYDKKGDEHYNIISALHKSIRASDDNAALYWLNRMLAGGEDPMFIARRLVRAASEDIGLADPSALPLAVSAMDGCQLLGVPECEVLLAQCAVYLARAPKSTEVYKALGRAKELIAQHQSAQPSVPLHLRNIPMRLMKHTGPGKGSSSEDDLSDQEYMPEGLEHAQFF